MRYKNVLALIFCLVWPLLLCGCEKQNTSQHEVSFFAMDTYITLTAVGDEAPSALAAAKEEIIRLESLWSVTDIESDIHVVNNSHGTLTRISTDTAELIAFVLQMHSQTGGAIDPTVYPLVRAWGFTTGENSVPDEAEIADLLQHIGADRVHLDGTNIILPDGMMLDLGSVGKGRAGDLASQLLREYGITSALLDVGGNISAIGSRADGRPWRIGLRDPNSEGTLGVLSVSDTSVVTSGSYERYFIGGDGICYGHIIDPADGYPVDNDVASVTIIAPDGTLCDALSTALYVMGADEAVKFWRSRSDEFQMIMVSDSGEIHITEGAAANFTPDSGYLGEYNIISA